MPAKLPRNETSIWNGGPRYRLVSQTPEQRARYERDKRLYPGSYDYIEAPVQAFYPSLYERITEGSSPTGFASRELTNNVRHTKIRTRWRNIPRIHIDDVDGKWSVYPTLPGQYGFHTTDTCWRPALDRMGTYPPDIDGILADMKEKLFPQINPIVFLADDLNPFALIEQANDINKALDGLDTWRATQPPGVDRTSRAAANGYLAGHLQVVPGVATLLSWANRRALYDNFRAQADQFSKFGKKFRSQATVTRPVQRSETSISPWSLEKTYKEIAGSWTITYYCTAKGTFDVPFGPEDMFDVSAFEFLDPEYDPRDLIRAGAEALWELSPLSFVFDYFFPVGNMLSGAAASNVTVSDCGEMCKFEGTYSTGCYHPKLGWYECSRSEIKDFARSYSNWAIPDGFVFDWNNVLGPIGPRRQLTLLSLARSFT